MARLQKRFYQRETLLVARALLNQMLVTNIGGVRTSGIIVETEAYGGLIDEAAHSYRGVTKRTEVMFREGGFCYVYFIYGAHYCVNVVTGAEGEGSAVLIRAVEPFDGKEVMEARRPGAAGFDLTNGPGKLCKALSIGPSLLGEWLPDSHLIWLEKRKALPPERIGASPRVGISKATTFEWRFFDKGSLWVSKGSFTPRRSRRQ